VQRPSSRVATFVQADLIAAQQRIQELEVLLSNRGFPDLEARAELAEDRVRTLEDAVATLRAELDTTRETLESTQVRRWGWQGVIGGGGMLCRCGPPPSPTVPPVCRTS
jgi:multidrug resistance efflux pump